MVSHRDSRPRLHDLRPLTLAAPVLALLFLGMVGVAGAGDVVIQPISLAWQTDDPLDPDNPFTQQTPDRGFDGSGLDDASLVDNGDPIPTAWPLHTPWGNNGFPPVADVATRVLKAGAPGPLTRTLTLGFDAIYEVDGVALWNWSSQFNFLSDNNRGISTATVEVSTDGGDTFMQLDLNGDTILDEFDVLQFTEIPSGSTANYAPEVVSLNTAVEANAIRLTATNFGAGSMMGIGEIRFTGFATGLSGDYNGDGVVDAADYTVWRDGGSPDSTQAGYDLWRANYGLGGAGIASGTSAAPEPSTAILLAMGLAAAWRPLRSRQAQ